MCDDRRFRLVAGCHAYVAEWRLDVHLKVETYMWTGEANMATYVFILRNHKTFMATYVLILRYHKTYT